jgi:citrate lyase beta subunit
LRLRRSPAAAVVCIHPPQVATYNEVFTPTAARDRVCNACRRRDRRRAEEGKMIDAARRRMGMRLLAKADLAG